MKFVYAVSSGVMDYVDKTSPHSTFIDKLADEITDKIVDAIIIACKHITIFTLQISSQVAVILCLWFVLGMMIGSIKCRNWAGMAALSAMILKALSSYLAF